MCRSATAHHLTRLESELVAGTALAEHVVRSALAQALRDLAGSVSCDSLPEMAARLVAARLGPAGSRNPVAV